MFLIGVIFAPVCVMPVCMKSLCVREPRMMNSREGLVSVFYTLIHCTVALPGFATTLSLLRIHYLCRLQIPQSRGWPYLRATSAISALLSRCSSISPVPLLHPLLPYHIITLPPARLHSLDTFPTPLPNKQSA
jgi:hypothetical protein